MLPRPSNPVLHPDPADPEQAAQGQGPAVALAAQGQGQEAVALAVQGQGQEAAPAAADVAQAVNAPPPMMLEDRLVAPRSPFGLRARLAQTVFAAAALACMFSTDAFHMLNLFEVLIPAASLLCLWSLALAAMDVYSLVSKRSFRSTRAIVLYTIGDWVTGTLTFGAAAGAMAQVDMRVCSSDDCPRFVAAIAFSFCSWLAIVPSCIVNLGAAVCRTRLNL